MSFSFVQSKSTTSSGTGVSVTWPAATGIGHLLVAVAYWGSATETCTMVDIPAANTWLPLTSVQTGAGALSGFRMQTFYVLSSVSTGTTSANISGSVSAIGIAVQEYSFTGASANLDGTPTVKTHNSSTPTSDAVITTVNADLLFSAVLTGSGVTAAGSGFSLRESASFGDNGSEDDLDGGTAGSKTSSFSVTGTVDNIIALGAFRDAAATGVTGLNPFEAIPFMSNQRI